jgi:hypothetical protein
MMALTRTVRGMRFARRVEVGALAALAVLAAGAAAIGAAGGTLGLELPSALDSVLGSAAAMLGWVRLLLAATLIYGVVRVRED